MSYNELSEQEQLRRNSLAALRELGIEPYPAAEYPVTATAAEIAADFDPEKGNFQQVSIAGRIMGRRIMGSASFFELQDHTGRIQVYIRRDDICPEGDPTLYNTVFKKLLDIGDFVGVKGFAFITRRVNSRYTAANSPYWANPSVRCRWSRRRTARYTMPSPTPTRVTVSAMWTLW